MENRYWNILIKTISAGSIYGHKLKNNFNYFGIARNETHLIRIRKELFNEFIINTNKRRDEYKKKFLKKFFPKLRMYSDDIIDSLRSYFIREEYDKNYRLLVDGQFEENIYLIINGEFGCVKSTKRINLQLDEEHNANTKYVVLEKLSNNI